MSSSLQMPSLFALSCALFFGGSFLCTPACAEDKKIPVIVVTGAKENYSYRQTSNAKTISVMLYGFKDPQGAAISDSVIPKDRKALSAFFRQHMDRMKRDYLTNDPNQSLQFVTGGAAFNSTQLNRGPGLDAAKMVGMTLPIGKWTTGGGYTWGEKNPAMMRRTKAEGMFVGASYDTGRSGFQVSYLSSGQQLAGFKVGGSNIRYDSILFGTSFRVNKRVGLTATLQFRHDADPLTTGTRDTVFTVGTRLKF